MWQQRIKSFWLSTAVVTVTSCHQTKNVYMALHVIEGEKKGNQFLLEKKKETNVKIYPYLICFSSLSSEVEPFAAHLGIQFENCR